MNLAIIEQCVPWVEDLLAQIEDPDPCILEGFDILRRRLAGEEGSWQKGYFALGTISGPPWAQAVDSPSGRVANVLQHLLLAAFSAESDTLIESITDAWLIYTKQPEPEEK